MQHRNLGVQLLCASLALAACRETPAAFGPTPATARQNADDFFGAYASRYTDVTRSPKVSYIRLHLGRGTLIPSRVFGDTGVWTARHGDTARVASYNGAFYNGRYHFYARTPPDRPQQPGDSFHSTRLRRLSDNEYQWTTSADFALGRADAGVLGAVVARSLRAAETKAGAGVRADYRASFPRTTSTLGRLYAIDSLAVTRDAEGASAIAITIGAYPDRLKRTNPALADYLNKYVEDTQFRIVISDKRGARWFEMGLRNKKLRIRVRSRNGELVPLDGGIRALPDSLVVRSDFRTEIALFDVGWRNLVTEMTIVRGDGDRAWQFRSTTEPEWVLPPLARRFIRTPLRRPFAGRGVNLRIGVRETPAGPTVLYRRGLLEVQESAILRFLGRLSGTAMSDFYGRSEMDENSFNGAVFAALRADARDLLSAQ